MTRTLICATTAAVLLACVVIIPAAAGQSVASPPRPGNHPERERSPEALNGRAAAAGIQAAMRAASDEFGVPLAILNAVAYTSSGSVQRNPTSEGDTPPSYGVMGLRDDDLFGHSLGEAATLIGRDPETLRTDATENIRGGAALMARLARLHRGRGENVTSAPSSWAGVLADFSGIPQAETAKLFAETVLTTINAGDGVARSSGPSLIGTAPLATTSCSNVIWKGDGIPSTNYQVGRSGVAITTIVIHTTEGSAAATLATFQDPSRQASSTYLVVMSQQVVQ